MKGLVASCSVLLSLAALPSTVDSFVVESITQSHQHPHNGSAVTGQRSPLTTSTTIGPLQLHPDQAKDLEACAYDLMREYVIQRKAEHSQKKAVEAATDSVAAHARSIAEQVLLRATTTSTKAMSAMQSDVSGMIISDERLQVDDAEECIVSTGDDECLVRAVGPMKWCSRLIRNLRSA